MTALTPDIAGDANDPRDVAVALVRPQTLRRDDRRRGARALQAWLEADPAARAAYADDPPGLGRGRRRARRSADAGDPRALALAAIRAAAGGAAARSPRGRRRRSSSGGAAACAGWRSGGGHSRLATAPSARPWANAATVTLPDGSVVTLNTDTVVRTRADGGPAAASISTRARPSSRSRTTARHPFVVTRRRAGRSPRSAPPSTCASTHGAFAGDAGRGQGARRGAAPPPWPAANGRRRRSRDRCRRPR